MLVFACSDGDNADPRAPEPIPETPPIAVISSPEPGDPALSDPAVLESRDCRVVTQAYVAALGREDFAFAARFWNDATVDAAVLAANFAAYPDPAISIVGLGQEGAAGSLYCTADVVIGEALDQGATGYIVLKRVNDVDGASAQQLRWTIRSSSIGPELGPVLGD